MPDPILSNRKGGRSTWPPIKTSLTMRVPATLLIAILLFFDPRAATAWNDKTHIAIAYIAYHKLSKHARDRVDELLVLHPMYAEWTKGAKLGRAGLLAFLHASTWPDCIQDNAACPGYVADGADNGFVPPVGQGAWQNTGYSDHFMHKYWHFIAQPYATEDIQVQPAQKPNLETQLLLLTDALNSNAEDTLKSYDLAWVENLVGEIHQPLNTISRFTTAYPQGDHNGRDVKFCTAPCLDNLHTYWDNVLGVEEDLDSGVKEGKTLINLQKQTGWIDDVDLARWLSETSELAKRVVYLPPISDGKTAGLSPRPNDEYREQALHVAMEQVVLAGNRLASLLNQNLK